MEQFSKFLASRLSRQQQTAEAHPDADTLLAFAENVLKPADRQMVFAHLANCSDCRQILSLSSSPAYKPSLQWWNLRWAAGMAAILLAFIVVLYRPAPIPLARQTQVQPQKTMPTSTSTAKELPMVAAAPKKKFVPRTFPVSPVSVPAPSAAMPEEPAPIDPAPFIDKFQQQQPISIAPPPPQSRVTRAALGSFAHSSLAQRSSLTWKNQSQWKLSDIPGVLMNSSDGQTWHAIRIDTEATLLSLSVSGSEIWTGGESGTLFHSADNGLHWNQIAVPSKDSITAIRTEGANLILKTKSGDWLSSDGGQTWITK